MPATTQSRGVAITVAEVIEETSDARSIVFEVPAELSGKFDYKPGQFLTLRIPSDETGSVARCYSLSSSPFVDAAPVITVKRTTSGYASNWLCDKVSAGDVIEVLPPSGVFTPKDLNDDFLLLAAGSGITPVISILKSALEQGVGKVALVYANRDVDSVIFATELSTLASRFPTRLSVVHWLEQLQGLPSPEALATLLRSHYRYQAFMCGPAPFMDTIHKALALIGMPRDQVHAEVYASLAGDPFAEVTAEELSDEDQNNAAQVQIELDGEEYSFAWPRKQTLVDVMLSKGIDVPYSCREGECGSCACTLLEGEVAMDNTEILDPADIENGYVLGCQAHPTSDFVRIEF